MSKSLVQLSKQRWIQRGQTPHVDELQVGALQRIATATEKVAETLDIIAKQTRTATRLALQAQASVDEFNRRLDLQRIGGMLPAVTVCWTTATAYKPQMHKAQPGLVRTCCGKKIGPKWYSTNAPAEVEEAGLRPCSRCFS